MPRPNERITRVYSEAREKKSDAQTVRAKFDALCRFLAADADPVMMDAEWDKISKAYTTDRHYHNFKTLAYVISRLEDVEDTADRMELFAAAIYNHLHLYGGSGVNARGNTASSADEGAIFLRKLGVTEDYIERFKKRIMATRDYRGTIQNDPLGAMYVDAERSLLAAGSYAYIENAKAVRDELEAYDKPEYMQRRLRNYILPLLASRQIFATAAMAEYEGMARINLLAEKKWLEDQLGIRASTPVPVPS